MSQREGTLIYDRKAERYDVRFGLDEYYGGLHCGTSLEVLIHGNWKPTRIEYGDDWYLVGTGGIWIDGLRVRL